MDLLLRGRLFLGRQRPIRVHVIVDALVPRIGHQVAQASTDLEVVSKQLRHLGLLLLGR